MSSSKVIGSIFFATDELFWVKQLTVSSCPHFINHSGSSFTEESVEGIISSSDSFVTRHLSIRLTKKHILNQKFI
ncbi:hypothetical protein ACHQM5_008158 [Ranunculus cassubicifolius]